MPNRQNRNKLQQESRSEAELIQNLDDFYQTILHLENLHTNNLVITLFGIISNTPTLNEAFQNYQISLDINTSLQDLKTSILTVLESKNIQVQKQNQIQDFVQTQYPDIEFTEENLSTIQALYKIYLKSNTQSSFYKQLKKFSKYDLTQLRKLFELNNLDQTKAKLNQLFQEFEESQEITNHIPNNTPNPPTQNIETKIKPKPALSLTKPNKPTQSSSQIDLPLLPETKEIKELSLDQRIKVWQEIIQQNGYTFMEFYIKTGADQVSAKLDKNNSIQSIAAQLFTFKKYTRSIYNQTLEKLFDTSIEEQKQNCTDTLIRHIEEKHPTTFTFADFIEIDPQEAQLSLTTLYDLKTIYGPTKGKNDHDTLLKIFSQFTIQSENPTSIVYADTQENRTSNLIKHYQQAAEKSEITPISIICGSTPHIQQSKVGERSIYQIGRDISNKDYDTISGMFQTIETIFQTSLKDEVEQYLQKVANTLQENNINIFEDFKNSSSKILPTPLTSKFDIKYLNPALRSHHKNNKTLQKIWNLLSSYISQEETNNTFPQTT